MDTSPRRGLTALVLRHFAWVRAASALACALPALWLAGEAASGALGANPLERLQRFSGHWALTMLIVTFAVTPLRRASVLIARAVHARWGKRVSDWNWLIRLRRQFGLAAFCYAVLHVAVYVTLDAGSAAALATDMAERRFIVFGWTAFALMLPLALTSSQRAQRALGRRWALLHRLAYAVLAVALAHLWAQMKVGQTDVLPYAAAIATLFALRLAAWRAGDRLEAIEIERDGVQARAAGTARTSRTTPATSGTRRSAGSPESAR